MDNFCSAKEIRSLVGFVFLFVCQQDYRKHVMKLGQKVVAWAKEEPITFWSGSESTMQIRMQHLAEVCALRPPCCSLSVLLRFAPAEFCYHPCCIKEMGSTSTADTFSHSFLLRIIALRQQPGDYVILTYFEPSDGTGKIW